MGKSFSKKTTRKTKIILNPQDAGKIIEKEFVTKEGFKVKNEIIFSPEFFFSRQIIKKEKDGDN
jgi:hypothetical protein